MIITAECFSFTKIMAVHHFTLEVASAWNHRNERFREVAVANKHDVIDARFKLICARIFHNHFPFIVFNRKHSNDHVTEFNMLFQTEMIGIRMKILQYV